MNSRAVIEIAEYGESTFSCPQPTAADLAMARELCGKTDEGTRIEVLWLDGGKARVRANSWVGVAVFSTFEIRVVPKYVGGDLQVLRMLEYIAGLPLLRRSRWERTIPASGSSLFELICYSFVEESTRIIDEGLLHDYRPTSDRVPALRGRLDHRELILGSFGRLDRLPCHFDEYDADNLENQLIALAISRARARATSPNLLRELNRLDAIFSESCNAPHVDATWFEDRISYHRRNDRYRSAHLLAKLILEGTGIEDVFSTKGDTRLKAFFLNMNSIFEAFVARLLEDCLDPLEFEVVRHERNRATIVDAVSERRYSTLTPDVVVSSIDGSLRFPIEMKYKVRELTRVTSSDIYQSFTYALAFSAGFEQARAGLIHPGAFDASPTKIELRPQALPAPARICALNLDVKSITERLDGTIDDETRTQVRRAVAEIMK